ncbi:hypothetical protein [Sphingobacterium multivorum]|nr:hypothetical protein [Sphingobacterium multivorum]
MKTKKKPLKTITPKAVFNFKGTSAKSASGEPTTTLITTTNPTLSRMCE